MKTSGALLFFLFCLCEADYENQGTEDTVCGDPSIKPDVSRCPPLHFPEDNASGQQTAVAHSWPWQVSLKRDGEHFCSGSLIGQNWVVTAAHCQVRTSDLVVLGLQSINNQGQVRKIVEKGVFKNSHDNSKPFDYDIALIKLESPAQMNNNVSIVCLADHHDIINAGMNCLITGWGSNGDIGSRGPINLQQACLPIITNAFCQHFFDFDITPRMICAGGFGACIGDSGSPLVCELNGLWTLVGVTSFIRPDCPPSLPTGFARITALRSWIDKTMHDNGN